MNTIKTISLVCCVALMACFAGCRSSETTASARQNVEQFDDQDYVWESWMYPNQSK